jgi:hypothetical protein
MSSVSELATSPLAEAERAVGIEPLSSAPVEREADKFLPHERLPVAGGRVMRRQHDASIGHDHHVIEHRCR